MLETKDFKWTMMDFEDEAGRFRGYASVWGVLDAYGDMVERGAFKKSIGERKVFPLLWSHNINEPIGVVRLEEDEYGLKVDGEINLDVQRGRELRSLLKQKAVNGMSIGFQTIKDKVDVGVRKLKEIKLWEISLVVFPANEKAVVEEIRGVEEVKPYPNEHSCRIEEPDKFEEFRRAKRKSEDGKEYSVIYGKLKGEDKWAVQAFRYDKEEWGEKEAKKHCEKHGGRFERAKGGVEECDECKYDDASGKPDDNVSTCDDNPGKYDQLFLEALIEYSIQQSLIWRSYGRKNN